VKAIPWFTIPRFKEKIMTTIEFKKLCDAHDWYYQMSDDPRDFEKGSKDRAKLEDIMRKGGEEYERIYYSYQR